MESIPSDILNFPEVRVVEASAGSGKTFALAKRYIQLLLNPAIESNPLAIRHILALTFTNKAALEMKERILELLKTLALGNMPDWVEDEILKPLGISQEEASRKASVIMERIIHHYNFFQVQTIDKFMNALLSGCAFNIGLTANFRIETTSREYLEHSLDELINQADGNRAIRKIFEEFLHHYLYLENRTGWFPKRDILAIIIALFKQSNYFGLPYKASSVDSEEVVKLKRTILKNIKLLHAELPTETDKNFSNSLEKFLAKCHASFDIDSVSVYFAREEFPIKKDGKLSRGTEKLWGKIRADLSELCIKESENLFLPYVKIYENVQEHFKHLAAKDDVLFLEELNKKAAELFDKEQITVAELYYRLATRFHHYLIDEFQDTNRLQWHNLELMVEEALSTGGSLFYVGDKKQAIYSFRGGEAELFESVKDSLGHFNVVNEKLSKNWRSRQAIVDFNNAIFSAENLKQFFIGIQEHKAKDKTGVFNFSQETLDEFGKIYANVEQTAKEKAQGGYVKFEYIDIDQKPRRDEAVRAKLIDLVNNLKSRYAFKDLAILTRGNRDIEKVTTWFLEAGFPVESERTSNIKANALVQEIIYFLQFLESPINNLAFANFILGEIFLKISGLKAEEVQHFIFTHRDVIRASKDSYLYMEFRKKFEKEWSDFIEEFFKNVGLYPLYELIVSIYYRLGCLTRFPEDQGYLMHFLELVKNAEEKHPDLASFLDYFENLEGEELFVRVADSDAIKLLTIHKSKGLEFPVVILPFLGVDMQVGSSDDNQQSFVLKKEEDAITLLKLKTSYLPFCEPLCETYAAEYQKSLLSELNSIYVALTRAEHELYGFIPKKVGSHTNLLKYLFPPELYEMGKLPTGKNVSSKDKKDILVKLPASQCHDWISYLKDEFLSEDEFANRDNRRRGEVIHALLSLLDTTSGKDVNFAIQEVLEKGALNYPAVKDWEIFEKYLKKILSQQSLKEFFFSKNAQVFNEKEIVNVLGQTKRIDRLVVKKDEVWVIDYKSSQDKGDNYKKQVKEYMNLVAGLYGKLKVRGFILYLDRLTAEEVM